MHNAVSLLESLPRGGSIRGRRGSPAPRVDALQELLGAASKPQPSAAPAVIDGLADRANAARQATFELLDAVRAEMPHEQTKLHMSLQLVSNELGEVQRLLHDARERARTAG